MLAPFIPPFRWTDPSSWPVFFKVWLAFLFVSWLIPLWRWLQREQQKSWPPVSGRIDSAHLGEPKRFLGLTVPASNNQKFIGVLAYSYTTSGRDLHGEYRRTFASEDAALEFLRGLEGQTVSVQHHPNNPARSVLLEDTVETLLRNRPPLSNAVSWKDRLPGWLKPFLPVFTLLAFVGLLISIWIHIGSLFGRQVAAEPFFFAMHFGAIALCFPAVFVAQKRLGTTHGRDFWKAATKGSPDGLRYVFYCLSAYAWISGVLFFVQAPPGTVPKNHDPGPPWRLFSCGWMVFYYASFMILSSALRPSRDPQ